MFESIHGQHDAGASGAHSLTPQSIDRADPLSFSPSGTTSSERRDAPSYKSLCSKQALAWLRDRVVAEDEQLLGETVARLSLDAQRKCTLNLSPLAPISEPDAHTAWEYCQGELLFQSSAL